MGDYYNQSPIQKIIFSYGFKRGLITENVSKTEINLINFKDMELPISINPNGFFKGKVKGDSSNLKLVIKLYYNFIMFERQNFDFI